jgi:hypothetical protein
MSKIVNNKMNTKIVNSNITKIVNNEITTKLIDLISKNKDESIILLRNKEVIQWIFGDLSFLPAVASKNKTKDKKSLKILEDKWGQEIMKTKRPDLKLDKQWTNRFGEYLCEEIYTIKGKPIGKPIKKESYEPDLEIDNAIIEVKTQTFNTEGTAGEKILGCPFKYSEIPELYGKPLKIFCIGGAEKICKEKYGNLPGDKCSPQKQMFLNFFRENGIEYLSGTEIIKSLIGPN